MKHRFSVVNSENALEKVLEQKAKSSRVPGYRIAQRRDEERRGENKNALGHHDL